MAMTHADLDDIAHVLKVHPRTVLRALTGNPNEYWYDGHNPRLEIYKVARAFKCKAVSIVQALEGREEFLKPEEAAAALDLLPRTFRYRGYTPTIRVGRVVRYARSKLITENFARFD